MTEIEDLIYQYEGEQRNLLLFFHELWTEEYGLSAKVTFGNPCYYGRSWICYINPLKDGKVEVAFLRGNELSNEQGLLADNGRKQVRSVTFAERNEIPMDLLDELISEAIVLDETVAYASKRKKGS